MLTGEMIYRAIADYEFKMGQNSILTQPTEPASWIIRKKNLAYQEIENLIAIRDGEETPYPENKEPA